MGEIELLWISATNPAVSLPDLGRIREILRRPQLFVVVQDIFLTETAQLADVVLPAATWGEKSGTFTNADRTVHVSGRAVDPPGEARSDLEILLDYARRMGLRDRDGEPLVKWDDAELAYEPSPEAVSDGFPLLLTSGRTVSHFHTRTTTGRVPELAAARRRRGRS